MSLPRFAIEKRAITMAATIILAVWGLMSFFSAPRREDPEFQIRTCTVTTTWPGASAEKVEQLITDPIEKAVDELDKVKKVASETRVGISIIYVTLESDVEDTDAEWQKVRNKVNDVKPELPEGAGEPVVNDDFGDTSAMVLAVFQTALPGETQIERPYTPREMEIIADRVKDEIKLVPMVATAQLYGVREEVIYVETDMGAWSQLGMTTSELQDLLEARNIVAPGGTIDTHLGRFSVKPSGELEYYRQLENVTVDSAGSEAPVYLKDLGLTISRRYEEPPSRITRYGDAKESVPCVVLSFTMKKGGNITVLGQKVREKTDYLTKAVLPKDIEIAVVADSPTSVAACIKDFVSNLWQAIVIVVLVAFLLIGLRIALVMAAAIPIVILISFGICRVFGVQLEQVSIASLIIALGMLVDNAIEVGDNVHRLLEEGYTRVRAAVRGSEQISFPVLIATLTTVVAFLPMVTLPGEQGEYMYSLPVVVSVTLMVSWLVAMTTTTLMAYWVLRPAHTASPLVLVIDAVRKLFARKGRQIAPLSLSERYAPVVRRCVRHKWITVAVCFAAFLGACHLLNFIGSQFFPAAERDQFTIDVWLPNGASFAQTDAAAKKVERFLRELSHAEGDEGDGERLTSYVSYVGGGGPRFYLNLNPEAEANNYAQIVVNTRDPQATLDLVEGVREKASDPTGGIAGARVVPRLLDMGPGTDSPIGIRLIGEQMETLRHYADRLQDALREVDGTLDVHDSWGAPTYELAVDVDEDRAGLAGVSNASVARTLNAYFSGHQLSTYREGDHQVPITLRLSPEERGSLRAAKEIYVEGSSGKVPLDSVASLETRWQPAKIGRYKLDRMIEVKSRVEEGLLANVVLARAMPEIEKIEAMMPPGYRIEVGGEQEDTTESMENLYKCLGISVLLIILCLVVKYNSFAKPALIMVTIPMAAIGAFLGLFVTGNPLGFMSMLGLLSLAGIVLNDAIVLIEFVETLVKEKVRAGEGLATPDELSCGGLTREAFHECLVRGGQMRILPIFLTTLTTVGGLLPLAIAGGPLWEPMATVIIFGLLFATALTLLVLPSVYAIFVETFRVRVYQESLNKALDEGTPDATG